MLSYFALYGVVFVLGILLLMLQKKKQLSSSDKNRFIVYLGKIENNSSPGQQIIDCDKLYHQILKAYGYSGTFGEILKQKPKVISDIQTIWDLHKLRNKLVHELQSVDASMLQKRSKTYQRAIVTLLNQ